MPGRRHNFNRDRVLISDPWFQIQYVAMAMLMLVWFNSHSALGAEGAADAVPQEHAANTGSRTESTPPTLEELKARGARLSRLKTRRPVSDTAASAPRLDEFRTDIRPILRNACFECHGAEAQEGNIRIDTLDPNLLKGKDVDWWIEVLAVLTNGEMPPPDEGELDEAERGKLVNWLSSEIQLASTIRRATSGHSSFRRMTRYEYNYALQDILGLPWNFAKDLPPEAVSDDGFQNSSETLHMSLMQFETYRRVARRALKRATVTGERPAVLYWSLSMTDVSRIDRDKQSEQIAELKQKYKDDADKREQEVARLIDSFKKPHGNTYFKDLGNGTTVPASWAYYGAKYAHAPSLEPPVFPASSQHVAVIPQGRNQRLTVELGNQIPDAGTMRVRIRASRAPGERTRTPYLQLYFGWQASNEGRALIPVPNGEKPITATPDAPEIYQWDIPLGEIYPRNSVRKTSPMGITPSPSEYIRLMNSSASAGAIQIDHIEVAAPVYREWPPQSHRKIFFASENRENEPVYAREVIAAYMQRAWRQQVTAAEVEHKLQLYHAIRDQCDRFEDAIIEVLATVLSSPRFLYVIQEVDDVEKSAARIERLTPHELATRLSLFLWSSVPDEKLMDLAAAGSLSDANVLAGEVQRMLGDPRAERFSKHFVNQWLDMQLLDFLNFKQNFPQVDPLLKEAMQQEPVVFFHEMLTNNGSVLDFIHADYVFVNERLARHYGLPGVHGNEFRRVDLPAEGKRGGLLTQAGLLAMNSDGQHSHPLKRGIWMLESLLNDPPPPPPPAVPEIDLADPEIAKLTLKQRIEDHRNHAACMSCHSKIDPWGIAFENYDALGRWRDTIDGKPVDATSLLFNRQKLNGMQGLKRFLLEHRQDQFVRALVHKLATYALGRPLTFADRSSVDEIAAAARQRDDGLATIVTLLATSDLFQSK